MENPTVAIHPDRGNIMFRVNPKATREELVTVYARSSQTMQSPQRLYCMYGITEIAQISTYRSNVNLERSLPGHPVTQI